MDQLRPAGIRAEMDTRNEKIGYRIREAQLHKIPYMLVVGEREAQERTVALRSRKVGRPGAQKVSAVIELLQADIKGRI